MLTGRICLTIKILFRWCSFLLFWWPQCLIQRWYCCVKLDASHSQGVTSAGPKEKNITKRNRTLSLWVPRSDTVPLSYRELYCNLDNNKFRWQVTSPRTRLPKFRCLQVKSYRPKTWLCRPNLKLCRDPTFDLRLIKVWNLLLGGSTVGVLKPTSQGSRSYVTITIDKSRKYFLRTIVTWQWCFLRTMMFWDCWVAGRVQRKR